MPYKDNPKGYTRCEKCKYIDRENEKCKITNDNWLVSDRAGTCYQFEGVEKMLVKAKQNIGFKKREITEGKIYKVKNSFNRKISIVNDIGEEKEYFFNFFTVVDEKVERIMSRIDLVLKTDDFLEYDYKQDVIECRCPSEFGLKEYEDKQCNSTDYDCCLKCWSEFATKEEVEKLLSKNKNEKLEEDPHEKLTKEFEEQMEKVGKMFCNPIKPSHYQAGEFDVIAFCFKHNLDFASGNVVKYIVRAGKKDKNKELEDLLKAKEYLERKIERLEKENN